MISRDYHEFTLDDALQDAHAVVSGVRRSGRCEDAKFVVGHGIIRGHLMLLLQSYGLSPTIQMGNRGVVLCVIE